MDVKENDKIVCRLNNKLQTRVVYEIKDGKVFVYPEGVDKSTFKLEMTGCCGFEYVTEYLKVLD